MGVPAIQSLLDWLCPAAICIIAFTGLLLATGFFRHSVAPSSRRPTIYRTPAEIYEGGGALECYRHGNRAVAPMRFILEDKNIQTEDVASMTGWILQQAEDLNTTDVTIHNRLSPWMDKYVRTLPAKPLE
jgi:hypothetical protein